MNRAINLIKNIISICEKLEGVVNINKSLEVRSFDDLKEKVKIPKGEYVIIGPDERDKKFLLIADIKGSLFSMNMSDIKKFRITKG